MAALGQHFLQQIVNVHWGGKVKAFQIRIGFSAEIPFGTYDLPGGSASFSSTLPIIVSSLAPTSDKPTGDTVSSTIPFGENATLSCIEGYQMFFIDPANTGAGLDYAWTQDPKKPGGPFPDVGTIGLDIELNIPSGHMLGTPRQGNWTAGATFSVTGATGGEVTTSGQHFFTDSRAQSGTYGTYSGPFFDHGTGPIWLLTGGTGTLSVTVMIDPPSIISFTAALAD